MNNRQVTLHVFERLARLKSCARYLHKIGETPSSTTFAESVVTLVTRKFGFRDETGLSYAKSLSRQWYDDRWRSWLTSANEEEEMRDD